MSVLVDPMWGAGQRLDLAAARRRPDPGHRDPPGAQPVLRRRQPRADPARTSTRRWRCSPAAATTSGLLLDGDADRAGAADERGTFIHQLAGHRPADVLPGRAPRAARPGRRVSVNNTSMAARLGEHYGIATHETPVGFKFIGPKMIETGAMMGAEESGGFGFGMHLPERDGIYADLLLLDLFLRERAAGRWPVSRGDRALPRARRPVVLPAHRRPRRAGRVRRSQAAPAGRPARQRRRPSSPASRSPGPLRARHRRRLQVLPRRRVVAARPGLGHRAARPRLHRGHLGGAARRAARRRRAAGARRHERRASRRPGGSTSRGATS